MHEHCGTCGWPMQSARACEACGQPRSAPSAAEPDANVLILGALRAEDFPELEAAFAAWKLRDWNRLTGQCLTAAGILKPQITTQPDGPAWAFMAGSAPVYMTVSKVRNELTIESPLCKLPVRLRVPMMRALLELNTHALGAARFCLRDGVVVLRFADRVENLSPPKLVSAIREVSAAAARFDGLLAIAFGARSLGQQAKSQHLAWSVVGTPRALVGFDFERAPAQAIVPAHAVETLPAPVAALEQALEANEALCNLASEALRLTKPLAFQKVHAAVPLLLQRAFLYRAYNELAATCPDAIGFLMKKGEALLVQVWESPAPGLLSRLARVSDDLPEGWPLPVTMEGVLLKLVHQRAQVGTHARATPSPLSGSVEIKAHFKKVLTEIEKAPTDVELRHYLLLGGLAELVVRARLPQPTVDRIRHTMNDARAFATQATVGSLHDLMKAVAA